MKCIRIEYRKPSPYQTLTDLKLTKTTRRSKDQYYEKLLGKQKKINEKKVPYTICPFSLRPMLNTSDGVRSARVQTVSQKTLIPESMNIAKMRCSSDNILIRVQDKLQTQFQRKQKKFRSTFVPKKKQLFLRGGTFSLKGIRKNANICYDDPQTSFFKIKKNFNWKVQQKNCSRIKNIKKIKLTKKSTVIISVDFVLNENNFWHEQQIEESTCKNWKALQQHSNIIWLITRQGSGKKLEKYANDFGLRLDGIYQLVPKKKSPTMKVSLLAFENDFKAQVESNKNQKVNNQVIVFNSLKVASIQKLGYEEFYNSFPVTHTLKCIVHFIQIDTNDKNRFNFPLKILSKQKLPKPNSVSHFFQEFQKNHQKSSKNRKALKIGDLEKLQQLGLDKEEMMLKHDCVKREIIDYFKNDLKISMNKKISVDESEYSLQFLIGDMLRRNFNLMYRYQKQAHFIKENLLTLLPQNKKVEKVEKAERVTMKDNLLTSKISSNNRIQNLISSKLLQKDRIGDEQKSHYRFPVFLWKN